jgi:hypothetical protein
MTSANAGRLDPAAIASRTAATKRHVLGRRRAGLTGTLFDARDGSPERDISLTLKRRNLLLLG